MNDLVNNVLLLLLLFCQVTCYGQFNCSNYQLSQWLMGYIILLNLRHRRPCCTDVAYKQCLERVQQNSRLAAA